MKKTIVFVGSILLVLSSFGLANATLYEYYSGYQPVYEGEFYSFVFDLTSENSGATTSTLDFKNDVAVGSDALPLNSAFVNIDLFSEDWSMERVYITLAAIQDDAEYVLYDGWFNAFEFLWIDRTIANFSFDITDGFFLADPSGELNIVASITSFWNYNDFAITEVGIGTEGGTGASTLPVPEPATLLLLGTGLIGLAGVSRKKIVKRK